MLRQATSWIILALVLVVYFNNQHQKMASAKSAFSWHKYDKLDEINDHISSIDGSNCRDRDKTDLRLRKDVITEMPVYNTLMSRVWYKNRTSLIHLHNMALNRAFFYSYVLQKMNSSQNFYKQPNWMYFYFSASADVNANPSGINGSAFYFDNDCHYPNWYTTVPFNNTLPLFGPKVFRHDDYADQDNYLREPTRSSAVGMDAGAGRFMNYTRKEFKMNPWYENWLPDLKGDMDSLTKFTYYIGIKESNVTGQFVSKTYENFAFFGPNSPSASTKDERQLPVQYTAPYFDCGGSNKWVISAVSPVVDFMPRYTNWTHLRRQRIVGAVVMDIDLIEVDFNGCAIGVSNKGPNYLAGIDKCRKYTNCKQRAGYGLRRGGYHCVCKNGFQHPIFLDRPYKGEVIEQATEEEYSTGFTCTPTDYKLVLPLIDQKVNFSYEGGGDNSGGLPSDLQDLEEGTRRRRREADSMSSSHDQQTVERPNSVRYGKENGRPGIPVRHIDDVKVMNAAPPTELPNQENREPTSQELMALAERIRDLRISNKLQYYLKRQGSRYHVDSSSPVEEDDYVGQNDVDYTVEREYQEDLQQHREYRDFLISANRESQTPNMSRVTEALRDDVIQMRERHQQRFHANRPQPGVKSRRKRSPMFDNFAFDKMMRILRWKGSVSKSNCDQQPNHRLTMPGDVGYGASKQFENEGRTALRLSNFLSMYLQNVMPDENFGNLRGGGPLHKDMMFGEVIANVMGNFRIYSAGVYFDRWKFENDDGSLRELFGPWAFRRRGAFFAEDTAGYSTQYVDSDWFRQAKARHGANFFGSKKYKLRAYVRSNPQGTSSIKHEFFPIKYFAATYEMGFWTKPHFRCDGKVDAWVVTYVSPFFGLDSLRTKLEFRGVTTIDVPLSFLEVNQCPMPFSVANAFKNTARCDYFSTNCKPMPGFTFSRGSYRCNCRLGFEYWHADGKGWIEGSLLEFEYEKKKAGIFSRFDNLRCRPSSGAANLSPGLQIFILLLTTLLWLS
ncbi:hypothetical protein RRG08_021982 [Elysia crispata]|uniref:GPR158/179 extracellular domain-containing protein n=1 Tax=Elysia crispata TaxID=231223 RepID=A0AAE1CLR9_9GAST|nr:hypothetical protein RRG08_021982 [Elysia crispata]